MDIQLDCYDILSDSDTKTEATLRVRIEQAKECTPCLLVLRNVEAFSQTTQAAESGKGGKNCPFSSESVF